MSHVPETSAAPDGLADRVRLTLAVPVAFVSSVLGVVCVVSMPDVATTIGTLSVIEPRFVGWAGVAGAVTVGTGAAALLLVTRIGPGPALSLGAAASVFGLALAREVAEPAQLKLALLLLGAAVGCLLGGAASMTFELPDRLRRQVMVAWALPVVAAWPLLAWVAGHVDPLAVGAAPRLTYHPSVWVLAPVSALIVMWSAVSMLVEPPRATVRSGPAWETAWGALIGTGFAAALATMAIGFDPGLPPGWLRPLVLFASGAVVVTLAGISMLLPPGWTRIGYVLLVFVLVTFPTTVQLLVMVADDGASQVSWWLALLMSGVTVIGDRRRCTASASRLAEPPRRCCGLRGGVGDAGQSRLDGCLGASAVSGHGRRVRGRAAAHRRDRGRVAARGDGRGRRGVARHDHRHRDGLGPGWRHPGGRRRGP